MSYHFKYINELKEKLEKTSLPADQKYQYLRGILDFIETERESIITPVPPVVPVIPTIKASDLKPVHAAFTPKKIIKYEPKKQGYVKNLVKEFKTQVLTTLAMCGKDCYMTNKDLLKYNDYEEKYATAYQTMNKALTQLVDSKQIIQ